MAYDIADGDIQKGDSLTQGETFGTIKRFDKLFSPDDTYIGTSEMNGKKGDKIRYFRNATSSEPNNEALER